MTLRRASFGLLVLASACSRAPAGVSESADRPIPSECQSEELAICVESCRDSACVEWCAGEVCAVTIASVLACTDDALRFSHERWNETCQPICAAQVVPPTDGPSFCDDWRASYHAALRWNQPPPESSGPDELSLGTSMWLVGELAQRHDDRTVALTHMIEHWGWPLGDVESCVPELDERGRDFFITLALDQTGVVSATHVRDNPAGGDCVADAVASALTLPVRVARQYPQLEVRVVVKPLPTWTEP